MKKRTLTISLIVLAIMLLVGIGYAGWVITRSDSGAADGNFTAYSVEDSGALSVTNNDQTVKFGWADSNPAVQNPWLTYGEGQTAVEAADLEASFDVTWSGGAQSFNLTHTFQYGEDVATVSPLLIGAPTYTLESAVNGVSLTPAGVLSFTDQYTAYAPVTILVTYTFGSLFNSQNPYVFFNGKGVTAVAFTDGNYNGGSVSLATVQGLLGNTITATSTFADVANAALSKLDETVTGSGTALTFKVAVAKVA